MPIFRRLKTGLLFVIVSLHTNAFAKDKAKSKAIDQAKGAAAENEIENAASGFWLPDWGTPSFGLGIGPIAGFRSEQNKTRNPDTKTTTLQSELGVRGYINGVPVIPTNPGIFLRPHAGFAWGRIDGNIDYPDRSIGNDLRFAAKYNRYWLGSDAIFYYHWYRHTLGVIIGRKTFTSDDTNQYKGIQSFEVSNDFGVAVVPLLSGHYTHRYLQANYTENAKAFFREQDHWTHAQFAISALDWTIDFGPGWTFAEELNYNPDLLVKGRTDYLKLVGNFDLFWKFYAAAYAKYVYASTYDTNSEVSHTQLPDEGLYDPRSLAMPEDSLSATELIGISNLFLGFGVAYQMQQQIINMTEKNGSSRQETRTSGIILSYETKL